MSHLPRRAPVPRSQRAARPWRAAEVGPVVEEPGGGRLLCCSPAGPRGEPARWWLAAPDGRPERELGPLPAAAGGRPHWLDRSTVAWASGGRLAETRVWSDTGRELGRVPGALCSFDVTAGRGLLCAGDRSVLNLWEPRRGSVEALVHAAELAAGGAAAPVAAKFAAACWSADGRRLCAVVRSAPARGAGDGELYVLETGGTGCRRLGAIRGDVQWRGEDARIFARVRRGGAVDLVAWSAAGGPAEVQWADFPGHAVAVAPAGGHAVALEPTRRAGEVAVVRYDFGRRERRTLAVAAGGMPSPPSWTRDGRNVFALLTVRGRTRLHVLAAE
jgi:hypothetical protein